MSQFSNMTPGFPRCSATESSCPLQSKCLRSLVWNEQSETDQQIMVLPMVNYKSARLNVGDGQCQMYRSTEKLRYARGMSHLFDEVPHALVSTLTKQAQALFSSRRTFYYCKDGTQLTTPEQQEALAALFAQHNLTLPPFDDYEEHYDWS